MDEALSDEDLKEIRRRWEASTPGPWVSYIEGRDFTSEASGDSVIGRGVNRAEDDLYLTGGTAADQDFIAHAHQDLPLLLGEIERLRKIIQESC